MRVRDAVIRYGASPYGLTVVSVLIFLTAYLLPPTWYSRYVQEPDYLFLDPASLLFFLLCTLGFVAGLVTIDLTFATSGFARLNRRTRLSPTWFILLPVVSATAMTVYSSVVLVRENANLLVLLLAAQAEQLKEEGGMQVNGPISQATPLLMGIVWWAIWRKDDFAFAPRQKLIVNGSILLAIAALVASATLMVARGEVMPIFAGIAITFLLRRLKDGKLTFLSATRFALTFAASVVLLFIAFSILRGQSDPQFLIASVFGYSIASYNRLAALLSGLFHYPFSDRGLYISAFVSFNKSFNAVFHINRLFDWPDFDMVWRSEFDAVAAAGLNGQLIWSGAFGYIFSDLGWFSPLLLYVYGLATGWTWRSLKLGQVLGAILYPWCGFCILYWFGTNYLLDPKVTVLILCVILISLYESLLLRTQTEAI